MLSRKIKERQKPVTQKKLLEKNTLKQTQYPTPATATPQSGPSSVQSEEIINQPVQDNTIHLYEETGNELDLTTLPQMTSQEIAEKQYQALQMQTKMYEQLLAHQQHLKVASPVMFCNLMGMYRDDTQVQLNENNFPPEIISPRGKQIAQNSVKTLSDLGVTDSAQLPFPEAPKSHQSQMMGNLYTRQVELFLKAQEALLEEKAYVQQMPMQKQYAYQLYRQHLLQELKRFSTDQEYVQHA